MDFAEARRRMVDSQIRPNRVTDARVLAAMGEVPREEFVPELLRGVAYVDEDIEIGERRYLMEPLLLARLLQGVELKPSDVVLDIGCGTGYTPAVVARLVSTVVALECDAEIARRANQNLIELGIDNAAVIEGPLAQGYPEHAPYDVIFLSGGVATLPPGLIEQLAEGGRLIGVFRGADGVGRARMVVRQGGLSVAHELFNAATPLLPGFETEPEFVFQGPG